MRCLATLAAAAAMLTAAPALAQTATPAPAPPPVIAAPAAAPCSISNCSGLYVRAGITGLGTNVDVIGNGLSGSLFAGGSIFDVGVGYQLWNGTYFAAVEGSIGYQASNGPSVAGLSAGNIVGLEQVKFGGALSGLLGQGQVGTTTGGQAPAQIPVPAGLSSALIAPYYGIGMMQRGGSNVMVTGPGAEFALASSVSLDVQYLYQPAMDTLPAAQMVRLGLQWHF
jgi:opacity protein-like surface antigen